MSEDKNCIENKKIVSSKIKLKASIFLVFPVAYILIYIITKDLQIYNTNSSWDIVFYLSYWFGFIFLISVLTLNIYLYTNMHDGKRTSTLIKYIVLYSITVAIILFAFTYHLQWLVGSYLTDDILSSQEYIGELYHIILPTFIPIIAFILAAVIYFICDFFLLINKIKK